MCEEQKFDNERFLCQKMRNSGRQGEPLTIGGKGSKGAGGNSPPPKCQACKNAKNGTNGQTDRKLQLKKLKKRRIDDELIKNFATFSFAPLRDKIFQQNGESCNQFVSLPLPSVLIFSCPLQRTKQARWFCSFDVKTDNKIKQIRPQTAAASALFLLFSPFFALLRAGRARRKSTKNPTQSPSIKKRLGSG